MRERRNLKDNFTISFLQFWALLFYLLSYKCSGNDHENRACIYANDPNGLNPRSSQVLQKAPARTSEE